MCRGLPVLNNFSTGLLYLICWALNSFAWAQLRKCVLQNQERSDATSKNEKNTYNPDHSPLSRATLSGGPLLGKLEIQ